jgi:hypothetical protein
MTDEKKLNDEVCRLWRGEIPSLGVAYHHASSGSLARAGGRPTGKSAHAIQSYSRRGSSRSSRMPQKSGPDCCWPVLSVIELQISAARRDRSL